MEFLLDHGKAPTWPRDGAEDVCGGREKPVIAAGNLVSFHSSADFVRLRRAAPGGVQIRGRTTFESVGHLWYGREG